MLRPAGAGHDAEGDLGQREAHALRGIDTVAAQRQLAAAGIGRTIDRPDDRDRAADKRADHPLEQQMLILPGLVGHAVALFEVAAGAERPLPRAGQDNATLLRRRRIDLIKEREEIAPHLRVQRVGDVGAVQGQEEQPLAAILDPCRLVLAIHPISPPRTRSPGL